jgi:hypothetical protein
MPAWLAGVPIRVHGEHGRDMGDLDGTNRKYRRIRRLYRPFVSHYVALSKDLERSLRSTIGEDSRPVAQIYNGVDTARFAPVSDVRARMRAVRSPRRFWPVGTVGRMQQVKDR